MTSYYLHCHLKMFACSHMKSVVLPCYGNA